MKTKRIAQCFRVPDEIEIEILSRLPVKSLLRFKSVKKSWRDLIQDPAFIAMHLNCYCKNNVGFLLPCSDHSFKYFKYNHRGNDIGCRYELELSLESSAFIIGSINGLVCLRKRRPSPDDDSFRMRIWNPWTRRIVELPRCPYHVRKHFVTGFGFCQKFNDYKVIQVYDMDRVSLELEVQVYSLDQNSWRSMKILNPGWVLMASVPGNCFLNGALHWRGEEKMSSKRMIISFRFDDEVFREINVPNDPDFRRDISHLDVHIIEYQNCLSLIVKGVKADVYDLWVMKEYGVSECWIKQFTFRVHILTRRNIYRLVMSVEHNGELRLFLRDRLHKRIVVYNTNTKQIEELPELSSLELERLYSGLTVCRESLVSLCERSS